MTITLVINNPHYTDALQELARAAGMEPQDLCSAILTKRLDDFTESVRRYKADLAASYTVKRRKEGEP